MHRAHDPNQVEGDHEDENSYDEEEGYDDDQDDMYDEEETGNHRRPQETSYFEDARGFGIHGGSFSAIGGHYYGPGHYPAQGNMGQRPGPNPSSNQSVSYFRGSSDFTITSGNFMAVSGDYYGGPPSQRSPPFSSNRGGGWPRGPSRQVRGNPRGPQRPPPTPYYPPGGGFPPESGPPYVQSSPAVLVNNPGAGNQPVRGHFPGRGQPTRESLNSQRRGPGPTSWANSASSHSYGPSGLQDPNIAPHGSSPPSSSLSDIHVEELDDSYYNSSTSRSDPTHWTR